MKFPKIMPRFGKQRKEQLIEEKLREITINGVSLFGDDYVFGQHEDTTYGSDELDENGELPLGWVGRHYDELKDMEENIGDHVKAAQDASKPVDERIAEYETAICLYNRMKERFDTAGGCYAKYFSDMWENCHNSKCDSYKYIDSIEEDMIKLRENYEVLKRREMLIQTLDDDLIGFITSKGTVLQTDVFMAFDPVLKTDIQNRLYNWDKEGRINREKSGRSYLISLTDSQ